MADRMAAGRRGDRDPPSRVRRRAAPQGRGRRRDQPQHTGPGEVRGRLRVAVWDLTGRTVHDAPYACPVHVEVGVRAFARCAGPGLGPGSAAAGCASSPMRPASTGCWAPRDCWDASAPPRESPGRGGGDPRSRRAAPLRPTDPRCEIAGYLATGTRTPHLRATSDAHEESRDPGLSEREDAGPVGVLHALVAEGPLVGDALALPDAVDRDHEGVVLLGAQRVGSRRQGVEVTGGAAQFGARLGGCRVGAGGRRARRSG